MSEETLFAEVESYQQRKHGEVVCGDAFFSQKMPGEGRVIGVVSDGLGSGIKANILANMTGKMALRFSASNMPIMRSADIIMDSLPVCKVRRISYATFTIVDAALHGRTRVVEMGNPHFLFVRDGKSIETVTQQIASERWPNRVMRIADFCMQPEDRIIVFSDGVSQAGLGSKNWKLGWRTQGCAEYVERLVNAEPTISARMLAKLIVLEALRKDERLRASDDMTCAVFYFRRPRKLLVLSGPPFHTQRDREIARQFREFKGAKVICGGTTAGIVSRELNRSIETRLPRRGEDLPPPSTMPGVDLVTEGILTLTRTAQYLDSPPEDGRRDAAVQLAELLRENDVIHFKIGTRINEAHQDPTLPIDLEIRRNIIKRVQKTLAERYLKEVTVEYV